MSGEYEEKIINLATLILDKTQGMASLINFFKKFLCWSRGLQLINGILLFIKVWGIYKTVASINIHYPPHF